MALSQHKSRLIAGPVGALEVVFHPPRAGGGLADEALVAVVCHPHPQHGGTMDNKVVTTLVRGYGELGIPAVRFNFRGTGHSEGVYDRGVGEVEDLMAVARWVERRYPDARLLLAGFSFGSGVAGNGAHRLPNCCHLTLVAPPVGRYGFSRRQDFPCPWLLIMGGKDELVDPAGVFEWARSISPSPSIIEMPDAGHFFHGHLVALRKQMVDAVLAQLRDA